MDNRIKRFIRRRKVMTLAVIWEGVSWSAPLFYAFDENRGRLIFTSSPSSKHIIGGISSPAVSLSIVGRSQSVARLRGAQILGTLHSCTENSEEQSLCRKIFLKRFPFAAKNLDKLWYIDIASIKYTDNRLGFAKKLHYNKTL